MVPSVPEISQNTPNTRPAQIRNASITPAAPEENFTTFHEFAQQSTRFSSWADQFYRRQREKGKPHHSAIRSLAFKWIRIVFACWKTNKPYDESLYINALAKRTSSPSST